MTDGDTGADVGGGARSARFPNDANGSRLDHHSPTPPAAVTLANLSVELALGIVEFRRQDLALINQERADLRRRLDDRLRRADVMRVDKLRRRDDRLRRADVVRADKLRRRDDRLRRADKMRADKLRRLEDRLHHPGVALFEEEVAAARQWWADATRDLAALRQQSSANSEVISHAEARVVAVQKYANDAQKDLENARTAALTAAAEAETHSIEIETEYKEAVAEAEADYNEAVAKTEADYNEAVAKAEADYNEIETEYKEAVVKAKEDYKEAAAKAQADAEDALRALDLAEQAWRECLTAADPHSGFGRSPLFFSFLLD